MLRCRDQPVLLKGPGMPVHRYNSNKAHQGEVDDMADAMEASLYEHGVDAVFAGHVHAYERSYRSLGCACFGSVAVGCCCADGPRSGKKKWACMAIDKAG